MDPAIANWWMAYSARPPRNAHAYETGRHAGFARAFEHYRARCLKSGALNGVARAVEQAVIDFASHGELLESTVERLRDLTLPQPISISPESLCLVLAALEIDRSEQCSNSYVERLLAVVETA